MSPHFKEKRENMTVWAFNVRLKNEPELRVLPVYKMLDQDLVG